VSAALGANLWEPCRAFVPRYGQGLPVRRHAGRKADHPVRSGDASVARDAGRSGDRCRERFRESDHDFHPWALGAARELRVAPQEEQRLRQGERRWAVSRVAPGERANELPAEDARQWLGPEPERGGKQRGVLVSLSREPALVQRRVLQVWGRGREQPASP